MSPRFASIACAVVIAASCTAARAEQLPPRDIWPQAATAAREGDLDAAIKQTNELVETGRAYGIRRYPLYAAAASGFARQSDSEGKKDLAEWAEKTAAQLDAKSPSVAFSSADMAAAKNNWAAALPAAARGLLLVVSTYRTSILSRSDLVIVVSLAIALTAIIFAIALFIRYGRSMAHDFREFLGRRVHGGSVSVLAFALLFLPIFVWLGPMWLVFYWFAIFFGYANAGERALIIVIGLLVAGLPLMVDLAGTAAAAVDAETAGAETANATGGAGGTARPALPIVGPGGHAAGVEPEIREAVLKRLKRIEGQVRGLQRMVAEERYCADILMQIASAHEALRGVGKLLMRNHLEHCVTDALRSGDRQSAERAYEEVLDLMYRHAR